MASPRKRASRAHPSVCSHPLLRPPIHPTKTEPRAQRTKPDPQAKRNATHHVSAPDRSCTSPRAKWCRRSGSGCLAGVRTCESIRSSAYGIERKRGGGARTARSNEVVWRGWGQRRGREGSRRAGRAGIRNVEESDTGRERPTHPISLKKWILLLGRKSAAAIECTGASPQR